MSDMIDRLRAVSAGAGRDIATNLAAQSTIESMAGRVRQGVRRRRIRIGAIGVTAAVIVAAAAIAAPALLSSLPDDTDIQPGIVRTVGPITTYDDDSLSVVLANGALLNLPAYEGDLALAQPSVDDLCAITSPADLPAGTWAPTTSEANQTVSMVKMWVTDDSGVRESALLGAKIEIADPKEDSLVVVASFDVDPAIAPFVAIKTTVFQFKADPAAPSGTGYTIITAQNSIVGEPKPEYSGTTDLGTRVGTVQSRPISTGDWSYCFELPPGEGFWTGTFEWYVVSEIYLVDHMGGAYPLGTSTYWFQAEVGL